MNIFLYELKSLRKSMLLWTVGLVALAGLYLSVFPSMVKDAEVFKSLLASYPEAIRVMLGINLDYITSLLGFYSMIFTFILLCGAIQAMTLGVSLLSKESRERTADFLLVKPISRTKIVNAKLLAAIVTIIMTNLLFLGISTFMVTLINTQNFSLRLFILINLTMFFIQLIFLALGMLVSVFFKRIKNVLPISLGLVFGFYLIGSLLVTDMDYKVERIISPFKYFDITYIMDKGRYETLYLLISSVIIVVAVTISYVLYNRKDIPSVS